ncbi:CST complex subunit Ten1 [Xylaria sp. CBS 124048]|nr:CST complex subunit Ten1 [Xylaria sp. CBS 124048]
MLSGVIGYSTRTGQVILKHGFPKGNSDVEAVVDVKLLLGTLKSEQTDIGQWVHVIGYLTFIRPAIATDPRNGPGKKAVPCVDVQAILLWTARDLDLGAYEKSLLADSDHNTVSFATRSSNEKTDSRKVERGSDKRLIAGQSHIS